MARRIRLTERADQWEARDLDVELSVAGNTRQEALEQLDSLVAATTSDGDVEPPAEEFHSSSANSDINHVHTRIRERLDELREESISADDAPEDPSVLNQHVDADRTLDEIFNESAYDERRELRRAHPSGWLYLTQPALLPVLVDSLLSFPPGHEFSETELAEDIGVTRQTVAAYSARLENVEIIEEVPNTSPRRYRVSDSEVVRELHKLNSALNNVGDDE